MFRRWARQGRLTAVWGMLPLVVIMGGMGAFNAVFATDTMRRAGFWGLLWYGGIGVYLLMKSLEWSEASTYGGTVMELGFVDQDGNPVRADWRLELLYAARRALPLLPMWALFGSLPWWIPYVQGHWGVLGGIGAVAAGGFATFVFMGVLDLRMGILR